LVYRQQIGESAWENSPIEQARSAAHVLEKMLKEDKDLVNYAGKLDFPYRYAGVLPNLPPRTIEWLEKSWGINHLIGRDDLKTDRIQQKIESIPAPFTCKMTENQVRSVCAILDDRNKVIDQISGEFKGIYNRDQEEIAKELIEPLIHSDESENQVEQSAFEMFNLPKKNARVKHLESGMPTEVSGIKKASHIRLLRGFAGTGKTDVLILRAFYLTENYPEIEILVTTFNRPILEDRLQPELDCIKNKVDVITFDSLCSKIFVLKHGQWIKPQETLGLINKLVENNSSISEIGSDFIAEEIVWLKESGLTERNQYINCIRGGRGNESRRRLSKKMKSKIFDIYEEYENELKELPAHDWVDLHEKTWKLLLNGVKPFKTYDAILIDEAQHFAPTWMKVIQAFLNPGGSLFISDDPSQSVYRLFSWRQRGVDVVGRTRWLRIPYRNTRQIFKAAYSLIKDNFVAQQFLSESGEQIIPEQDHEILREGEKPQVYNFNSFEKEKHFVFEEVNKLINIGLLPEEIGLLHTQKHIRETYRQILPRGLKVDEPRRQTGMEYKAVFIPRLQDFFKRDPKHSYYEDLNRKQLIFYMTMARARDYLYLLYGYKWPKELDPINPYVEWHE